MTKIVQIAGGTRANQDSYTGPSREVTMDTDGMELRLHDGSTAGGHRVLPVAQNNLLYQAKSTLLGSISDIASTARGFPVKTGPSTVTIRSIVGTAGQITVADGNGVANPPTISLPDTITKAITFSAGIVANVTGNVTGNLTGNSAGVHTGNVTGDVTGNVTGNLTGDANGDHIGTFTGTVDVTGETLSLDDGQIPQVKIAGTVVDTSDSRIPVTGMIVIWSGTVAAIPTGWALCDGTGGTPDLRGMFIIGAGDTGAPYEVGDSGGSSTHNHGGSASVGSGGSHSHTVTVNDHTLTTDEIPSHAHIDGVAIENSVAANYGVVSTSATWRVDTDNNTPQNESKTSPVGGGQGHNHTASSSSAGTHSHTSTITSDSNMPPYYALALIMKT